MSVGLGTPSLMGVILHPSNLRKQCWTELQLKSACSVLHICLGFRLRYFTFHLSCIDKFTQNHMVPAVALAALLWNLMHLDMWICCCFSYFWFVFYSGIICFAITWDFFLACLKNILGQSRSHPFKAGATQGEPGSADICNFTAAFTAHRLFATSQTSLVSPWGPIIGVIISSASRMTRDSPSWGASIGSIFSVYCPPATVLCPDEITHIPTRPPSLLSPSLTLPPGIPKRRRLLLAAQLLQCGFSYDQRLKLWLSHITSLRSPGVNVTWETDLTNGGHLSTAGSAVRFPITAVVSIMLVC